MKNYFISIAISAIVAVLAVVLLVPKSAPVLGASSGPDHYNQENFYAGMLNGTQVATSSTATAVTISANDFKGWAVAGMVSYTQGLLAPLALTLPASSTIASIVPKAGDTQRFCFRNATTTAALSITFTGGSGTNLLVASSSLTTLGSANIITGKVACITLVREAKTATTFDIDALLTAFN